MLTALFTVLSLACTLLSFASGVLVEREEGDKSSQFLILGMSLAILGTVAGVCAGAVSF